MNRNDYTSVFVVGLFKQAGLGNWVKAVGAAHPTAMKRLGRAAWAGGGAAAGVAGTAYGGQAYAKSLKPTNFQFYVDPNTNKLNMSADMQSDWLGGRLPGIHKDFSISGGGVRDAFMNPGANGQSGGDVAMWALNNIGYGNVLKKVLGFS